MTCSILIVNYKVPELLRQTLESVRKHTHIDYEVIVVDNHSQDHSLHMLLHDFPWVKTIPSSENLGFAGGNNLAANHATGRYLFCLNPDTILQNPVVDRLCEYLDKNSETGIAAPKLLYEDGTLQRSIRPFYSFWGSLFDSRAMARGVNTFPKLAHFIPFVHDHSKSQSVDWVKGAAFVVRKHIVDKIGFFNPDFFVYGEEMDLCHRVHKAGWKIDYITEESLIHLEGKSTSQQSEQMYVQNYKSLYIYLSKHYSLRSAKAFHLRLLLLTAAKTLIFTLLGKEHQKSKNKALREWIREWGKFIIRQNAENSPKKRSKNISATIVSR